MSYDLRQTLPCLLQQKTVVTSFVDSSFLGLPLVLFALQRPETLVASGLLCALYVVLWSNFLSINIGFLIFALSMAFLLMIATVFGLNHGFSSIFYVFKRCSFGRAAC